jgi:hypothetical protein
MVSIFAIFPSIAFGSENVCGDVNYDNVVNFGDVVYIVNFVFREGPPPQFLCDGDVNGDRLLNIGDAVYLMGWLYRDGQPPDCGPGGGLVVSSGCHNQKDGLSSVECIFYDYDGGDALTLNHVNVEFNCCPGELVADIFVPGNTIIINEYETDPNCACRCLYDLDLMLYYFVPGEYTIEIHTPYPYPQGRIVVFTVDLSGPTSGSYCLD